MIASTPLTRLTSHWRRRSLLQYLDRPRLRRRDRRVVASSRFWFGSWPEMPRQQQWGAVTIGHDPHADFVAEILNGRDGNEGGADQCGDPAGPVTPEMVFESENLEAERQMRAKLNNHLFTLRSLVPRITKMSREAILTDAIDYIQELQRQKEQLQKVLHEMADEDSEKQGSASSTGATKAPAEPIHCKEEVEVCPLGKNKFRASVVCRNKKVGFTKLVEAMSGLGMEVTNANFLTHDGVSQVMLCTEVRGDQVITADKVRDLLLRVI